MEENELLLKRNLRDEMMNEERLEVLDKVKSITTIPNTQLSVVEQVANYYEVGVEAIKSLVKRNQDELISNGYQLLTGAEIKNILVSCNVNFTNNKGYFSVEDISFANRSNGLFTKRTILNVGMLLEESQVAKEVRTLLLDNHFQLQDVHDKLIKGEEINIDKTSPTYFIDKETELREKEKSLSIEMTEAILKGDMNTYLKISCEVNGIKEEIIALAKEKEELSKSKVAFHDAVNDTTGTIKIGDFAKLLTKKGFKIGEKTLFKWLRDNKMLSDVVYNKNKPYQRYLDDGYFEMKENVIKKGKSEFISYTPLITGKGQIYLEKKLREWDLKIAN